MTEKKDVALRDVQSVESLISEGIKNKLPVDTMERLLAMRRELKAEQAKEDFVWALSQFQKDCPVIVKDKVVKNGANKVLYSYAPLDSIVKQLGDLLTKHGFSYSFTTEQDDKTVTAICHAQHNSGHSVDTSFRVPVSATSIMSGPQACASALTYAKRYAFLDAFGILTGDEDDDAQATEVVNPTVKVDKPTVKDSLQVEKPAVKPPIKDKPIATQSPTALSQADRDKWVGRILALAFDTGMDKATCNAYIVKAHGKCLADMNKEELTKVGTYLALCKTNEKAFDELFAVLKSMNLDKGGTDEL